MVIDQPLRCQARAEPERYAENAEQLSLDPAAASNVAFTQCLRVSDALRTPRETVTM